MKYFLHDSTAINQDSLVKLISNHGFEGYGIYFAILERIAFMESPIDKNLAIFTLRLTKKQQKILNFCIEIGLLLQENEEIFEENLLENAKKYIIRKEKTKEKVKKFRENVKKNSSDNQLINENVTCYDTVTKPLCNQNVTTANKSKVNKSKVNIFVIPTQKEIELFFNEIGLNGQSKIESEKFFNFYASKDWFVGKNKMKNWQAAARNWKSNIKNITPTQKDLFKIDNSIRSNPDRMKFTK